MFLNQTKIWYIKHELFDSNRGWYLNVTFSIEKDSHYFNQFLSFTKDFKQLETWIFNLEDYEKYKEEEKVDNYDYFSDECFHKTEGVGFIEWNPPKESPYSILLKQRLSNNNYVQMNHNWLTYNEKTNIFNFSEAITSTKTTEGALLELYEIQCGITNSNYQGYIERYILNILTTLDMFLD